MRALILTDVESCSKFRNGQDDFVASLSIALKAQGFNSSAVSNREETYLAGFDDNQSIYDIILIDIDTITGSDSIRHLINGAGTIPVLLFGPELKRELPIGAYYVEKSEGSFSMANKAFIRASNFANPYTGYEPN